MTNEDIDGLLSRVSDDLRIRWEKRILEGKSLHALREELLTAQTQKEIFRKRGAWLFRFLVVMIALFLFLGILSKFNPYSILVFFIVLINSAILELISKKQIACRSRIGEIENIFERFNRSVQDLNPRGTVNWYQDQVDEKYIMDRAVTFAVQVLEAERSVDTARNNQSCSRLSLCTACARWEMFVNEFESYSRVVSNNFNYEINRSEAFRRAEAHLKQTNPTS